MRRMIGTVILTVGMLAMPVLAEEMTEINAEAADMDAAAEAGDEDGQNPVMNYIGTYVSGRARMTIEADGSEGARVHVMWGSSANETGEWTMSGPFDDDAKTITYADCIKKGVIYENTGEIATEEILFDNGTGTITFHDGDNLTLTWLDDQEDIAADSVFEWVSIVDPSLTETEGAETGTEAAAAEETGTEAAAAETVQTEAESVEMLMEADGQIQKETAGESASSKLRTNACDVWIEDGVMTISISGTPAQPEGYHWEYAAGGEGDESVVQLLTSSDMEEGLDYVASFRALDDGKATIRIDRTNGTAACESIGFEVVTEGGRIVENPSGFHYYSPSVSELESALGGVWMDEKMQMATMMVDPADDGLHCSIAMVDGSGAYVVDLIASYDCVTDHLVYKDASVYNAAVTAEAASDNLGAPAVTDAEGWFTLDETEGELRLLWHDSKADRDMDFSFVKTA